MLKEIINKWYKKYIYSFDPYHLRFKAAIKTVFSMLVTAFIFYNHTPYLIWAVVASFITGMIQSGSNIKKRRVNMLITIILITLLAPLLSLISSNIVLTVSVTIILTFILIYIGVLGKGASQVGMISLIYIIVFTNYKVSLDNIQYVFLAVFSGGIIAFFFHYILLPVKPTKVYKVGMNVVLTDMEDFCQAFQNIDTTIPEQVIYIDDQYQKTLISLEKFKTLPGFLGYTPEKEDGPNTSMIYLTNLLGQILEEVQSIHKISRIFSLDKLPTEEREKIIDNINLCLKEFKRWINAFKNNKVIKTWHISPEIIDGIQNEFLTERVNKKIELSKDKWGRLFQIIFQLKLLATDLPRLSDYREKVDILIDKEQTVSFKDNLAVLKIILNSPHRFLDILCSLQ